MVWKHGTVLECFDSLNDRVHVLLSSALLVLVSKFAEEKVQGWQVILLSEARVMAHQNHQSMYDVCSMRVFMNDGVKL